MCAIASGSSPLARGTQGQITVSGDVNRLIPARAGNTRCLESRRRSTPAHPRSRGEHCSKSKACVISCGSSPLARGTLFMPRAGLRAIRLIPARAGNTHSTKPASVSVAAHPRSRGEHHAVVHSGGYGLGSSPLARGTPQLRRVHATAPRLIPARAGNTLIFNSSARFSAAHPRSRGEHLRAARVALGFAGSSPLARGTHGFTVPAGARVRLIPARAGNTLL